MKKIGSKKQYIKEFITDAQGRKVGVVLALEKYNELMEDLQDLSMIADRKNDDFIPYGEAEKKLKKNGKL